jgi:hypothetical protein
MVDGAWKNNSLLLRGAVEGLRRRDAAHRLLRARRAVYVRRGQRALLLHLLDAGTATVDAVRAAVELPPEVSPCCFGAVPGTLADAGLIHAAGYQRSTRAQAHARPLIVWALADRDAALAWLVAHPDLPDPADADAEGRPLKLWD